MAGHARGDTSGYSRSRDEEARPANGDEKDCWPQHFVPIPVRLALQGEVDCYLLVLVVEIAHAIAHRRADVGLCTGKAIEVAHNRQRV